MDGIVAVALAVVLIAALSVEFYYLRCITLDGALAAFAVGAVVAVFGSINSFFLLTVFTVAGFAATLYQIKRKKSQGTQEGEDGERTWKNVAGVGLPPCLIVLLNWAVDMDQTLFTIMFVSTIAVAGADTIASEIGVRDSRAYMITTFRPVEPGVNGGVSRLGTAASTVASLLISVVGWLAMTGGLEIYLLIPFVAGVAGNILDSLFGTLLEDRGYMSKYTNNASTALLGAVIGAALFIVLARSHAVIPVALSGVMRIGAT